MLIERIVGSDTFESLRELGILDSIRESLRVLDLLALLDAASRGSQEDLRWGARMARGMFDYAVALAENFDATGIEQSDIRKRTVVGLGKAVLRLRVNRGIGTALVAPALLLWAADVRKRSALSDVVQQLNAELPGIKANTEAARSAPEKWRRYFGPNGLMAFATLPPAEVKEVLAFTCTWLAEHPEEAPGVSIQAASKEEALAVQEHHEGQLTGWCSSHEHHAG